MSNFDKPIPSIEIPSDVSGFFNRKDFKWDCIKLFSVITGVNGSGKSQMLDWTWNNLTTVSTINPPLNTHSVLYKKAGGSLANERNTLPEIGQIIEQFENSYKGNIVDATTDIRKKQLLWEHPSVQIWFSYHFTQPKQALSHLINSQSSLNDVIRTFSKKDEYTTFLRREISKQEFNIIDIINKIGELIRCDAIRNNNTDYNLWLYSKINAILATIEDNNSRKLFKHKIKKPQFVNSPGDYTLTFVSDDDKEISFNELSSGEQVMFELLCYRHILSEGVYKDSQPKVMLLDEFDAHLNPILAKTFIKVIEEQFVANGVQVIMTTHSPSTVAYVSEENVFWMEQGKIQSAEEKEGGKIGILHTLATGVMIENGCPFMSYLVDMTKPYYILVEGYTDILHIQTACKKLGGAYKDIIKKCNFLHLNGVKDAKSVEIFVTNFNGDHSKPICVIVDNDKTGNECYSNLKHKINNIITLQSDNTADYKAQIKYKYIPIEFLYKKDKIQGYIREKDQVGSGDEQINARYYCAKNISTPDKLSLFYLDMTQEQKKQFAKHAQTFDESHFDGFKPTLDLVLKVIEKWEETNPQPK